MDYFSQKYHVKWSDVDPNMHMRGTVYLDFADAVRIAYMNYHGLTIAYYKKHQIGPVLFDCNLQFKKEVYLFDEVEVNCKLDYLSEDKRKFGISHEVISKQGDVVAEIKVNGAMMDLVKRKITPMPEDVVTVLNKMNGGDK